MKTETFAQVLGDIDESYVEAAEKRGAKGRVLSIGAKRALRIAIAAAAVIILTFGIVMTSGAKGDVLPPARWGIYDSGPWVFGADEVLDFGTYYEDPEAICLVTIGNWLGDNGSGTFIEAHVDKLYKGDLPETFVIYQSACQRVTFTNYPVFTYGDKMLIGVSEHPYKVEGDLGLDKYYYINGEAQGVLYYAADKAGNEYVFDPEAMLSVNTLRYTDIRFKNYSIVGYDSEGWSIEDTELLNELYEDMDSRDREITEIIKYHKTMYPGKGYRDGVWYGGDPDFHELYLYSLKDIEEFFAAH